MKIRKCEADNIDTKGRSVARIIKNYDVMSTTLYRAKDASVVVLTTNYDASNEAPSLIMENHNMQPKGVKRHSEALFED